MSTRLIEFDFFEYANFDFATRKIYYHSEEEYQSDLRRMTAAGRSEESRLIRCWPDGSVEVGGVPLKLTPKQRIIMRMLEKEKCERGEMMDAVLGVKKIQESPDPDGLMRKHISLLNAELLDYDLNIDMDELFYYLKKF